MISIFISKDILPSNDTGHIKGIEQYMLFAAMAVLCLRHDLGLVLKRHFLLLRCVCLWISHARNDNPPTLRLCHGDQQRMYIAFARRVVERCRLLLGQA
jgi:hypothetical protein